MSCGFSWAKGEGAIKGGQKIDMCCSDCRGIYVNFQTWNQIISFTFMDLDFDYAEGAVEVKSVWKFSRHCHLEIYTKLYKG